MSSGEFGSFIPIWGWHPVWVGLFVFGIDFGANMFIRIGIERKFYLTRWMSFRVGDTIGLPVYAGFAAVVISDGEFSGFYTQTWFHVLAFAVGYLLISAIQANNLRTGFMDWSEIRNLSEVYHALIFGVMFYLMTTALIPLVLASELDWITITAFVGLVIYIGSFVYDNLFVDKTPGRYRYG